MTPARQAIDASPSRSSLHTPHILTESQNRVLCPPPKPPLPGHGSQRKGGENNSERSVSDGKYEATDRLVRGGRLLAPLDLPPNPHRCSTYFGGWPWYPAPRRWRQLFGGNPPPVIWHAVHSLP